MDLLSNQIAPITCTSYAHASASAMEGVLQDIIDDAFKITVV